MDVDMAVAGLDASSEPPGGAKASLVRERHLGEDAGGAR